MIKYGQLVVFDFHVLTPLKQLFVMEQVSIRNTDFRLKKSEKVQGDIILIYICINIYSLQKKYNYYFKRRGWSINSSPLQEHGRYIRELKGLRGYHFINNIHNVGLVIHVLGIISKIKYSNTITKLVLHKN